MMSSLKMVSMTSSWKGLVQGVSQRSIFTCSSQWMRRETLARTAVRGQRSRLLHGAPAQHRSRGMDPSTKRALLIGGAALAGGVGVFFALNAFEENLMFYLTPTQVLQSEVPIAPTKKFRLGGMVKNGSISHDRRSLRITFLVTDYSSDGNEIRVEFEGMLPDLFREGQGVVAEGFYDRNTGIFRATEVLAKHDENYMPKEIKEQLQKQKLDDVVIGKS